MTFLNELITACCVTLAILTTTVVALICILWLVHFYAPPIEQTTAQPVIPESMATVPVPVVPFVPAVIPPREAGSRVVDETHKKPSPAQPPQPLPMPLPPVVDLQSPADTNGPEANTIERAGCAGGNCGTESNGWYLGKRLGRRR
jgi:hypothetical protein